MLNNCLTGIMATVTTSAILVYFSTTTSAQNITLDGTLGKKETLTGPNYQIRQSLGQTVGNNVFHSFGKFNLNRNEAAIFASGNNIQNILSRVTGGSPSSIDGLIRTLNQDVNLFFINPSGIVFGENARLDVGGSFAASTADSFVFGDGIEFSAVNPQAAPLLKVNVTPGLQYGENHPSRTIKNSGNLSAGEDLKLFAGNLDLQGQLFAGRDLSLDGNTIKVRDSVNHPFIAASGGKLSILGRESVDIVALNHPDSGLFAAGDMVLSSANPVNGDIHFWSGGNFQIEKLDKNKGDLFSLYDPIIRSQGDVIFSTYQGASLHILAGGKIDIGTAIITNPDTTGASINPVATPNLANVTLSDGTSLVIDGSQKPTLDIRAGVDPAVIGNPLETLGDAGTFFDAAINPVASPINNPITTSADITIGDVFIDSPNGTVLLTNQFEPNLSIPVGDINVNGDGLFGVGIDGRGFVGNGSDVFLDSRNNIKLNNTINTSANSFFDGNGGDINLIAQNNIAIASSNLLSLGLLGGDINLKSNSDFSATKAIIQSITFTPVTGIKGGNIVINATSLNLVDGSVIISSTTGRGDAGDIKVNSSDIKIIGRLDDNPFPSGLFSQSLQGATGNSGKVIIEGKSLLAQDWGFVSVSTFGAGNAGQLKVNANSIELIGAPTIGNSGSSGLFVTVGRKEATGTGGNLNIETERLVVKDGAQISVSTFGKGKAGELYITAKEVEVIGEEANGKLPSAILAQVERGATADAGNLNLKTNRLIVRDGGQISAGTLGFGNGGNLTVIASDIQLIGNSAFGKGASGLFNQVNPSAIGNAGILSIETENLRVTGGASVSSGTLGIGDAGGLKIKAKSIELLGTSELLGQPSGLYIQVGSSLFPKAIGNGGTLSLDTENLLISNGGGISAASISGDAGNINLNAKKVNIQNGVITTVAVNGQGGDIKINSESLEISDHGQLLTTTFSNKNAGDITLNIKDNLTVSGLKAGIFANTGEDSTGNGGAIIIDPEVVNITDGAQISVDSQGTGIGGDIELAAGTLNLDNGKISAETRSNQGGNINLNLQDFLLLRNNSQISTTAGNQQFGGDGGNITIDVPFIVAFPQQNSDITANAFSGGGGNVTINATGLFGIAPLTRNELVDQLGANDSTQLDPGKLSTNDITAISQQSTNLSREPAINTPDTDPASGLVELPSNLVDVSQQIAPGCSARGNTESRFVSTGRGGLPLNPNEALRVRSVITNWVDLPGDEEGRRDKLPTASVNSVNQDSVVEAQGWVRDDRGNVLLVAKSEKTGFGSTFGCD